MVDEPMCEQAFAIPLILIRYASSVGGDAVLIGRLVKRNLALINATFLVNA